MRDSLEIAKFIEKELYRKNMKPIELANKVGLDRSTISRYLKGTRKIPMDEIPKIASALDLSPAELLIDGDLTNKYATNIQQVARVQRIPILGTIACGEPILVSENMEGYNYEIADGLPSGDLITLIAKGDSMEPTIQSGSKVIVRAQSDVENGEIAAVRVNEETEATLKRVKKQGNIVILMPDNPKYEPIIVTENNPATIIGKAVRVTRDLI
ncbi:helix-turn-helix domain-containing protein [Lysinibacillus yapensis]|uniref:Helix-turn-helix domain-containing protein n=1 Tax=Ureibacillus yapensis TaxID=2304605 RepID=A0A396S2X0_9BACL|nr:LexA family transcriptional regulator [Lysinibacillus yapensis]RHW31117.1 helix-turn-helix domain-containing protein [Lysinibacillus yapensis]